MRVEDMHPTAAREEKARDVQLHDVDIYNNSVTAR